MSRNHFHEVSSLYRTFSPDINTYHQIGNGRDSYISYNNGGFWNIDIKPKKEYFQSIPKSTKYKIKYTTRKPVPFRFRSEGKGRDGYIIYACGNNIENPPLKKLTLDYFLRTNDDFAYHNNNKNNKRPRMKLSNAEYKFLCKRREIEKKLIDRLYTKEIKKIRLKNKQNKNNNINSFFIRKDSENKISSFDNKNTFKRVFSSGNINDNNNNKEKNFPSIIKNIKKFNITNNFDKKYVLKDFNNDNNYHSTTNFFKNKKNEGFKEYEYKQTTIKNKINNLNFDEYKNYIIQNNYQRNKLFSKNTQSTPNMILNYE